MQCYKMKWVFPTSSPKGVEVACGKCLACLSNKRNDWAIRLGQEFKRSKSAAFITLTYHPKFEPQNGVSKRHFQLFMKRLRKKSGERLRYFAVGEYGTKNGHPHYHAIIFNYHGNEQFLSSIWSIKHRTTKKDTPLGIVHIGKVNEASIMYTTKYIIQRSAEDCKQRARPFMLCSRRFGIGLWYLTDEMVKWHRDGQRNYTMINGEKRRLPRYYKEKIWPKSDFNPQWEYVRKKIAQSSKQEAIEAEQRNRADLASQGYDPDKIITEMRNAVMSRIKQKTAFTQTM